MERRQFKYGGETFEEGELVLVNGKELMYCISCYDYIGGDTMICAHPRNETPVQRYKPPNEVSRYGFVAKCIMNNDKITHVYDPEPYNQRFNHKDEFIINNYLIDGWVICILLMILCLIFKPVGLWSLSVLVIWLILRHQEVTRIKNMR